ncbi:restriction endonuclease subunit S [Leptothoe spongobia]|uniref:Restriction endonuclease subunit S n=1 Tax=Leptothoe spongobia TAU-MAC 1115 TaxID=1967444 RepID=A0A947DAT8_9CYAN|nr:restriction endonuclease subunit S [Leptothoe spongobia]MBT9314002.1 restriction endonuclease subunit S [Leptothoe spongobia TAU-MAC 1115]
MKIGTAKHPKTNIEISQRNRNLPEGWSCETVGSLYTLIGGGTPSTKLKEYWNGSFPWITSADIQNLDRIAPRKFITADAIDNSTTNLVPSGTIVVVVTRVGLGKLTLTNKKICFSQDSQGLVDKTNGKAIYNKYALYYLSLAVREFKYKSRGTTINGVTKKQLSDLNFLLPPLAEQQRIVDKIEELFSELDEGIKSLKTTQQQLKIYRQAVLKWAFEGKLTAQWREEQQGKLESAETLLAQIKAEREQHYQKALEVWQVEVDVWEANEKVGNKPTKQKKFKELKPISDDELNELPTVPNDWPYIRAEGISDFITKGTTPKKGELFEDTGDIPFIKVYNLTHVGSLDFFINPTFVNDSRHHGFLKRSQVLPGDVLMNIVGPPLGKVSLVSAIFSEWNINQAIVKYRTFNSISNLHTSPTPP